MSPGRPPEEEPFTALVLAGDRGPSDSVAAAAGVPAKCLAPVGGRSMIIRVLDALEASAGVGPIVLLGPEAEVRDGDTALGERLRNGTVRWLPPGNSPSTSVLSALGTLPSTSPVLITTADHALLTPATVDDFCTRARSEATDAVAGVARHEAVAAAFPDMRRTALRFRDGAFCGCNLFAFLTPEGARVAEFWSRAEGIRKRPLSLARLLGPGTLLRYLAGRLTLEEAVDHLGARTGTVLATVELSDPAAAMDIDHPGHWLALRERA